MKGYAHWKEEEDHLLKEIYPSMAKEEILCFLKNKDWEQVIRRASKLNIKKSRWNETQITFIKEKYHSSPKEEICKVIGKSWSTISQKARSMSIYRDGNHKPPLENPYSFNVEDKSWAACALDGEGTISILKMKSGYYRPYITLSNSCLDFINHFLKVSNLPEEIVRVRLNKRHNNPKWKFVYRLELVNPTAIHRFLQETKDYYIIKKRNAELVMEFIEIQNILKIEKRNYNLTHNGGIIYNERQKNIHQEVRRLNKRGRL